MQSLLGEKSYYMLAYAQEVDALSDPKQGGDDQNSAEAALKESPPSFICVHFTEI